MKLKLLTFVCTFCFSIASFAQIANIPTDYVVCDDSINDGLAEFDLTIKNAEILAGQDPTSFNVTYHNTEADAASNVGALTSPYTNTSNPEVIFFRVEENQSGNFEINIFSLFVNPAPQANSSEVIVCDNDGIEDGITTFNLNLYENWFTNGELVNITFHETNGDAEAGVNSLPATYMNIIPYIQTLFVRVNSVETDCYSIAMFYLYIEDQMVLQPISINNCDTDINGFVTIDLYALSQEISNGYFAEFLFYPSEVDAENQTNAIPNAGSFNTDVDVIVYARGEGNEGCFDIVPVEITVGVVPEVNVPDSLAGCDYNGDGFAEFDLHSMDDFITGGAEGVNVHYSQTLFSAQQGVNSIGNPGPYVNNVPFAQTVYARVTFDFSYHCYSIVELDLVVETDCVLASSVTFNICTEDPNADVEIDLTTEEATILNGQNSSDFTITYYQSVTDAENEANVISNPQQYNAVSNTTLFARVDDNQSDNYAVVSYSIVFNSGPEVHLEDSYTICGGNAIVLTPSINGNQTYSYLWSTGSTDPEIVVQLGGVYTVMVSDNVSGCNVELSTEVFESPFPELGVASDLSSCVPNSTFDLTTTLSEILNGLDASLFDINFFNNPNNAFLNIEPIPNPISYVPSSSQETIYVRVQKAGDDCFEVLNFNVIIDGSCPVIFDCAQGPINNSFCYSINNQIQYTYESTEGLPLQVIFNAGQVEVNYDALIILDSDGVTNLNPESTTYGIDGNLSGLTFISTGNSITISVASDGSISCESANYTSIDYDVSCADPNALPSCNATLQAPEDGATDVVETTELSWSNASGIVEGYRLSIGLTSGGTEVLDHEDIGNVTNYNVGVLDYETIYYVTIVAYNANGDAEGCAEQSFTTRANPNQIVICDDGAVNTTHCYINDDTTEFGFQSSDGLPLTIIFNSGSTEVNFDEVYVVDSDGTILNPDLEYGNAGDFTGLTYTSSGDSLTVRFDSDFTISCAEGSNCCTESFDFDVFCASSVGFIQVNAFVDVNTNSVYDTNEFSFSNGYFSYEVNGDGMINTVNSSTGSFQIISADETDVYDFTFNLYDESEACYDITTASFSNISVATGSTVIIDFPVVEEQSCEDLAVYLINNWAPPRPGFTHDNYLYLENLGFTNIVSGTVEFTLDPQLVLDGIFSVNPAFTITNTATGFTVDFVNLQPSDVESIGISILCPVNVALDEIVTTTATYLTDTNDMVVSNNYSTLSEVVVGSWDPNDITESHGPTVLHDEFSVSDEWLYYTIRFQNLGTAEAIFVRIEDAIDDQLDKTTFQMLTSSHDYVVTRTENDLEWFFEDINLPAEQDDAEGSIGFVYFRIKPQTGYDVGDIIPNTAAIYFDFNAPVITNRFETQFVETLSVVAYEAVNFNMFPNPAKDEVNIQLSNSNFGTGKINIYNTQGKEILKQIRFEDNRSTIDISSLESGLYFVELTVGNASTVQKLIVN